jgi:thioredoxin-related protein
VERVVFVVVIAVVAVGVAALVQRRQRPATPTQTGYNVPDHVDRADFVRPEADWLVAVFTSSTCGTCEAVWDKAKILASEAVATQELEVSAERDLHKKYAIDGVPATVLVDAAGVVRASFLGPVTSTDLWATLAELRDPGSLPDNACDHGVG